MLYKVALSLLISSSALAAQLVAGFGIYSWQEKVDTGTLYAVPTANASFNSVGPSIGFDSRLSNRYRLAGNVSYHSGSMDIIRKGPVTTSRRYNYNSYWATGRVLYHLTRAFAIGPEMGYGQNDIKGLKNSTSLGQFINFDYELFNEMNLSQSIGSVGDSQQMAYSLKLEVQF